MEIVREYQRLAIPLQRHAFDTTIHVDTRMELYIGVGVHFFYLGVYMLAKMRFTHRDFFRKLTPPQRHEFMSYCVSFVNSSLQSISVLTLYYWLLV
eukprot:EC719468.1.p1 GENE.EC719468.1~~EC719468.1.p1  ORF type:complete len:112 (+),score=13.77 EC719468.1:50-337(+)